MRSADFSGWRRLIKWPPVKGMMMRLTDKFTKHPDTARILFIHADFLSIKTVKQTLNFFSA